LRNRVSRIMFRVSSFRSVFSDNMKPETRNQQLTFPCYFSSITSLM
jgi:hypothetical protein